MPTPDDEFNAPSNGAPIEQRIAPPIKIRLAWWLGIYFLAQLPLIQFIAGFYLYPLGLATFFLQGSSGNNNPSLALLLFVPYVVYILHLVATFTLRQPGAFIILMVILVILVSMNTAGCSATLEGLHHIN